MKRKTTKSTAFSKLKAGLEDAIAYHRGRRQLTVREVWPRLAALDYPAGWRIEPGMVLRPVEQPTRYPWEDWL